MTLRLLSLGKKRDGEPVSGVTLDHSYHLGGCFAVIATAPKFALSL